VNVNMLVFCYTRFLTPVQQRTIAPSSTVDKQCENCEIDIKQLKVCGMNADKCLLKAAIEKSSAENAAMKLAVGQGSELMNFDCFQVRRRAARSTST